MTLVEDFFEMRNSSVQYMLIDEDTNNCTIIDPVLDFEGGEADGATGQASRAMAVIAQELIWINAPTSDLEQNAMWQPVSTAPYLRTRLAVGRHRSCRRACAGLRLPADRQRCLDRRTDRKAR